MNAINGKIITTPRIGERADGAAFDQELTGAYSSNRGWTLTVDQEASKDGFKVIDNLSTHLGARTITTEGRKRQVLRLTTSPPPF